jgi:HD superfamily phosphohydrolase YqeK
LKNSLFDEIDRNIEEEDIKKAYKKGIRKIIEMHMKKNIQYLVDKKNLTYRKFITQYHHLIKK